MAMTDNDGKMLPECAASIATLNATGDTLSASFRDMQVESRKMSDTVGKQTVMVKALSAVIHKDVVPAIKELPSQITDAISNHETGCPVFSEAQDSQRDHIRKKLRLSSTAPDGPAVDPKTSILKERLLKAGIALAIAAASGLTTYFSTT